MRYKKSHNISESETLIAQTVLILAFIGLIFVFGFFSNNTGGSATLLIKFDNFTRMFEGDVVNNMTFLDALNAAVNAGNIELTYFIDQNNDTHIKEINNHTAGSSDQFAFYLNSKRVEEEKLNRTRVRPGDEIMIKLE